MKAFRVAPLGRLASFGDELAGMVAGGGVGGAQRAQRRVVLPANVRREGTARVEAAAGRRRSRVRRVAGQHDAAAALLAHGVGQRHRRQQRRCRDAAAGRTAPRAARSRRCGRDTSPRRAAQVCATTLRSWLMNSMVSPRARCSPRSRLMICARVETSSAETGSSATMKSGSVLIARAITARWRCPPEISCG